MSLVKKRSRRYNTIEQEMENGSITLFLAKKGVPAVLSVMIAGLYNLVDTYFVSGLGHSAVAGVSVVYAGITLVQTLAYVIGMGASGIISTALGEEKEREAIGCIRSGCWLAIGTAIVILIFGITMPKSITIWLGATDTSIGYAMEYGKYVIWSAPFMLLQMVLGNFLRGLNDTKGFMISSVTGGAIHILLCWWLVKWQGDGVGGAGMATLAGQAVSLVILVLYWWRKDCIIKIRDVFISKCRLFGRKKHITDSQNVDNNGKMAQKHGLKMTFMILKNGMPSLARQGSASISLILLNQVAGRYSDELLSAISIANKVAMLFYSVAIGLSQGYQPLAGFLYGAENHKRLRKAFYVTLAESTVVMTVMGVAAYVTATWTTGLFYSRHAPNEMAVAVLCWQAYTLPIIFLNNLVTMSYQTIQKALPASILSMLRQGICYIPLLYVLPAMFNVWGFAYLQPVAEIITFIVSVPFAVYFVKHISR